jgi:hypothetical protein
MYVSINLGRSVTIMNRTVFWDVAVCLHGTLVELEFCHLGTNLIKPGLSNGPLSKVVHFVYSAGLLEG